jgi:hypothetical protein
VTNPKDYSLAAVQAVKDAFAPDASGSSVHTFVVGMAMSNVSLTAQQALNQMAVAGGQRCTVSATGGACAHDYYAADNLSDLQTYIGNIAATAIPCQFQLKNALPRTPTDSTLQRFINNVPQPAEKGGVHWNWANTSQSNDTIQLTGSWCSDLQTNLGPTAYKFTVDFGCTGCKGTAGGCTP